MPFWFQELTCLNDQKQQLKIPYHDETSVIKGNQSNKIELKIEISKTGVDKGNHLEALNPLLKKKVSSIDIDENPRLKAH